MTASVTHLRPGMSDELAAVIDEARSTSLGRVEAEEARLLGEWKSLRPRLIAHLVDRMLPRPLPSIPDIERDVLARAAYDETEAVRAVRRFMAAPHLRFLFLSGERGLGKTFGAATALESIARTTAERWANGYERRLPAMIHTIDRLPQEAHQDALRAIGRSRPGRVVASEELRQHWVRWKGDGKRFQLLHEPAPPEVLLFEDLGTEVNDVHWGTCFTTLINERMTGKAKTIFTTNLPPKAIGKRYGERIRDRFNHVGIAVELTGKSLRRKGDFG